MKRYSTLLAILLGITLLSGCFSPLSLSEIKNRLNPKPMTGHTSSDPTPIKYDNVPHNTSRVLVRAEYSYREDLNTFLAKSGSHILNEWSEIGWLMVSVPGNETALSYIAKLRKVTGVSWAEPEMEYEIPTPIKNDLVRSNGFSTKLKEKYETDVVPDRPQYDLQWGHQNINSEAAWEITTGDPSVIVAVVDTGVDKTHPEFAGKTFIGDYNAIDKGTNVTDLHGHGTHVAGIAADNGRTGQIAGVAWDCPIMPVRVMDNAGSIYTSYLIEAMLYLANYADTHLNVRIVANMSIGGRGYSYAFKDAIDTAAEADVLLVTSAGNDYKRIIGYPSCYNGVVDVAASTPYNKKADFSTIGPWTSLAAPGYSIYSTVPEGYYESWNGTSMASPFACGVAALVLSVPEHRNLTPLQLKNQLEQTAQGAPSFSEELGYGVINAAAAVGQLKPMMYGSLNVTTNIISTAATGWLGVGVVSIYDGNGLLAGFGTTGSGVDANYLFHALKEDTYRVQVVYYDVFKDKYEIQSKNATVTRETTTVTAFNFQVPTAVTTTLLEHHDIDQTEEEDQYTYEVPFTVTTAGCYDFITTSSGEAIDTEITLYDSNNNKLAYNDDHEGTSNFSRIIKKLSAGDYIVVVSTWEPDDDEDERDILKCNFDINSMAVTY